MIYAPIPDAPIEAAFAPQLFEVRGVSVIIDADLARLFGVETKRLNQQTRRNEAKFDGFAFQLTLKEFAALRLQIVTSKIGRGGSRHRPYVFTEHGVVMAATVLQSEEAIAASRFIIKVFVEARRKTLVSDGANVLSLSDVRGTPPLQSEARTGLMSKLNDALGRVLDAIADPETQTTVRDEAHAIAAEGLRSIKEYLKRAGVQNEKTLAEVRKLLAEADALEAETAQKRTENQHRQLALLAKQLRLVLVAQQYLETGGVEGLLATLQDLERP
ncbi:ORF6N domain-containing protein [Caulobacter sp. BK020]|uniref:ORF6N domain-containing protein n=1 Tax=Caulobacter sp. BK020 TaxID=2512117 RepID=UPI0010512647|nr:ORF6N domain-containing protein [Caulobacter sp. BK020]TCS18074.1 ORF6N domain-containing protein [Caulobacter sp. BK020]